MKTPQVVDRKILKINMLWLVGGGVKGLKNASDD